MNNCFRTVRERQPGYTRFRQHQIPTHPALTARGGVLTERKFLSLIPARPWHLFAPSNQSFPIEEDEHLLTVMRYVERNPVRAKTIPIRKAQRWPWSSIGQPPKDVDRPPLEAGPVARGDDWLRWVNEPQTESELKALRQSISRGRPFGSMPAAGVSVQSL